MDYVLADNRKESASRPAEAARNDKARANPGFFLMKSLPDARRLASNDYTAPFAKAVSASCHGGRKRTNIDNKTNGRTSTQPAVNKPSLAKIGG